MLVRCLCCGASTLAIEMPQHSPSTLYWSRPGVRSCLRIERGHPAREPVRVSLPTRAQS